MGWEILKGLAGVAWALFVGLVLAVMEAMWPAEGWA